MRILTCGIRVTVVVLLAGAVFAQTTPPRDPVPPAKKHAARIVQLQSDAMAHLRAGDFDKAIAALEEIARLDPTDAAARHRVAVHYWEKAYKDQQLPPEWKRAYIDKGIAWEDEALALNHDYVEALTYKNLLLRLLGNEQTDLAERSRLYAEADALRTRAMELNRRRGEQRSGAAPSASTPPPPPPPLPPGGGEYSAPVRVGGNIAPPTKIRDVKPVYPPDAHAAGVSGVVICEVVIGTDGSVTDVRVLRSIPQLDEAAVEAVRQWKFTTTLLNGVPVPVIMTVTVNFTLGGHAQAPTTQTN